MSAERGVESSGGSIYQNQSSRFRCLFRRTSICLGSVGEMAHGQDTLERSLKVLRSPPCCSGHLLLTCLVFTRRFSSFFAALRKNNAVPAAVVLRKIATIINADAHPLPYPYRNIKQKAVVHQDDYKLEVGTRQHEQHPPSAASVVGVGDELLSS